MPTALELDAIDRRILRALQDDGRATYDVLGPLVGLSPSATLRRVKRLEDAGVISGYAAVVQAERVGLSLSACIAVRMAKQQTGEKHHPAESFAAAVKTWPEVVECTSMSGEMDYLLRVAVADMAQYSRFLMETLLRQPGVQECKTSFVLERVKSSTSLPL